MNKKLYIGNLSPTADKATLKALFSMFGKVIEAYVVKDPKTGESKGFGFVEMSTEEEAQRAIATLNGKDCGGYTVKVNEAKS
jgi:RNA recognition motif-containing protein